MESKRHRRKIKRTVMIVSNDINATVHQHSLSAVVAVLIAMMLVVSAGVGALCFYVNDVTVITASRNNDDLEKKIDDLQTANAELQKLNDELTEKNSIMGVTLDGMLREEAVREEARAQLYIPSDIPASKVVSMTEIGGDRNQGMQGESTLNDEGETVITEEQANQIISTQNPIILFVLQEGSEVMATGHGTVIAVGEDAEYGNVVRIDHGNGYVTIYRCSLEVRVHEGDDVVKGDPLFLMSNGTTTLGYQILQNAEFINPSAVMELKG